MTGQRNKTNKWMFTQKNPIWCPASTKLWPGVDLMLGQRRNDAGPTLNQHRVKVTGTLPFHAHAGEREDGADHGDVLEVVHQLTHHLPKLPAEREELGKLKKHNVIHIIHHPGEAFTQCWGNDGPPSATSAHHYLNIGSLPHVVLITKAVEWPIISPIYQLPLKLVKALSSMKWNEWGFRLPLYTYRLNWAKRTSWGWWDEWDEALS